MIPLYKISNEYQILMEQIESNEEVDDIALDALNRISDDFENKAIEIASHIKNTEIEYEALYKAVLDMEVRSKSVRKKLEFWKSYLKDHMEKCKVKKITKSPYFIIKLAKCPPSVSVLDEEVVPEQYKKIYRIVDRMKCLNDLKMHMEIPGVEIKNRYSLQIK